MNAVECLRAQASPPTGPDDYTLAPISAVRIERAAYRVPRSEVSARQIGPWATELGVRSWVSRRHACRGHTDGADGAGSSTSDARARYWVSSSVGDWLPGTGYVPRSCTGPPATSSVVAPSVQLAGRRCSPDSDRTDGGSRIAATSTLQGGRPCSRPRVGRDDVMIDLSSHPSAKMTA